VASIADAGHHPRLTAHHDGRVHAGIWGTEFVHRGPEGPGHLLRWSEGHIRVDHGDIWADDYRRQRGGDRREFVQLAEHQAVAVDIESELLASLPHGCLAKAVIHQLASPAREGNLATPRIARIDSSLNE